MFQPDAYPAPECVPASAPGWPTVLYFHHISPQYRHYTSITPEAFHRALSEVARTHHVIDPATIGAIAPQRAARALIALDDGHHDGLEWAAPILESFGMRAIFFVIPSFVGRDQSHPVLGRSPSLDWEDLRSLVRRGHVVANHSLTHRPMATLTADEIKVEVEHADEVLQANGIRDCGAFAYPYGLIPEGAAAHPSLRSRLCFGTVKSDAAPWDVQPWAIRRVFLDVNRPVVWREALASWAMHSVS